MPTRSLLSRLAGDERSVAPVIGFILVFAILITAFSSYQAAVVPNQNADIEFSHSQEAKDEMTKVRSAIFEARTSGEPRSTTFKLGVDYPNRLIALNPPPATGQLATGDQRDISLEYQDSPDDLSFTTFPGIDDEGEVYTQFLTYTPSYNEYTGAASIRHEHGILYSDLSNTPLSSGTAIFNENQHLVRTSEEGTNRITVVPIQGNYTESGVRRVSIDPEPGTLQTKEFDDINVTVPTKLTESQWEDLLEDDLPAENVVVDEAAEELTLVLDGTWAVTYAPVGVDGSPESGARGETGNEINPASPGDIRLVSSERLQSEDNWTVTFNNTDSTTNFTEGRVNFYAADKDSPNLQDLYDPNKNNAGKRDSFPWQVGGGFAPLDPAITLEGESETQLVFDFSSVDNNDEFFVVTFILESGEQATYFV